MILIVNTQNAIPSMDTKKNKVDTVNLWSILLTRNILVNHLNAINCLATGRRDIQNKNTVYF